MIRSLRARIFVASLLWTLGLLALTHLIFILVVRIWSGVFRVHVHTMLILALALMIAGLLLVRGGLLSLNTLRERLTAVRNGERDRIDGRYPTEVQPLVTELNALLDHRESVVRRALAKASDLAHGLKTPLAVIAHENDRVAAAGADEPSAIIRQQIERMRRQIDFHLAHARAAGSAATLGARSVVSECVDALIRTLERLHAERGLTIEARVPAAHAVRVQREDLEEMLGNLLDNACKWAKSRVSVSSMLSGDFIVIAVDDDGSGLEPALRETVLQRGVRADEAAPGTGLGLAIVRDLTELYGGSIRLESSNLGGLSARLELPRVPS